MRGNVCSTGARSAPLFPRWFFSRHFVRLVFHPTIRYATALAMVLFPVLAVAEFLGVFQLVEGCVQRPFNLLTILSFGALLVLLVIASYAGVFLAALGERILKARGTEPPDLHVPVSRVCYPKLPCPALSRPICSSS